MPWVEIFAVFLVSHLVGDYLVQTEWQARTKHGGLTGSPVQRRALATHVTTYTLCYVPALIWLWSSIHAGVFLLAVGIAVPHLIQDDGQLLVRYAAVVKNADIMVNKGLAAALDQSFHVLVLFATALIVGR